MKPAICQFAYPSRAAVIIAEEFGPMRRPTIDHARDQKSSVEY
jgi:hypothetical protein